MCGSLERSEVCPYPLDGLAIGEWVPDTVQPREIRAVLSVERGTNFSLSLNGSVVLLRDLRVFYQTRKAKRNACNMIS